jgi:tRNA threonylcarbamoyladenosine biosynthesis protein TsaE
MLEFRKPQEVKSNSEEETHEIAKNFANQNKNSRIVLLNGLLGAGKTTFVKGFAMALGANLNEIKSPTYTYFRIYQGLNKKIVHLDLYRMDNLNVEFLQELQEYLENPENIIIIEWPEKIQNYLPDDRHEIMFEHGKQSNKRLIKFNYVSS